jgi:hypothetical protein
MKKITFSLLILVFPLLIIAQTDYSGAYGYSSKPAGNPPKTESNRGPAGTLVLQKMEGNKYRFWLDITLGWPSYSVGETDGTIFITGDTASFDNTFENATHPCMLQFTYSNNAFVIKSLAPSYNCGFGSGISADGQYPRLKTQPVFNSDWLKKEYGQSPYTVVAAAKAELFQDDQCQKSFNPKKYLSKGDEVLSIAVNDKAVYTELFPSPGKFVYGWIKKEDLKMSR